MDGICKIRVKGIEYTLRLQRAAVEIVAESLKGVTVYTSFESIHTLIFAGLYNEALFQQAAKPVWGEVLQLAEDFHMEEDATEQLALLNRTFEESRWGADFLKRVDEVKKKMEEVQMETTSNGETSDATALE